MKHIIIAHLLAMAHWSLLVPRLSLTFWSLRAAAEAAEAAEAQAA
jgi:hypothetical protein